eukprot:Plantae.Rhodophyta-Purpureofilum_apyrenoidigerum.ctg5687.p1 GENE.Plantae.Rhodophyta-Purpureofilum_apyrenoidigerum.ctg5687~~Plantae.Rhodophyta-Purpureofilum_apyrenoidigerum.ctg5687.p1  ORF type:complete len:214 (-),score=43.92 Plantae.Rhodophyta-Purpureofilum_apyrenoidigerum.ctg5687:93-734(-)
MAFVGALSQGVAGRQRSKVHVSNRRGPIAMIREGQAVSRRDMLAGAGALLTAAVLSPASVLAELPVGVAGQVEPYKDTQKGFKILKPSGWNEFSASENFDIKWQDIIEPLEQITVLTTPVSKGKTVKDIGTPEQVGEKLAKSRGMQLVKTSTKDDDGVLSYIIELKSDKIHQVTVLTISKSKLYTVNASCSEGRWGRRGKLFSAISDSFVPKI